MTRMSRTWRRLLVRSLPLALAAAGCHHLQPPPVAYPAPPPVVCPEPPCPKETAAVQPTAEETHSIDLPTALRLADGQSLEIALARERIREAVAQEQRAEAYWLPSLELGPTWTRHDGQIQRSTGEVITVSRSALFAGGGATLWLDLGDALFYPLAARQVVGARQAGAAAVANDRLLDVALTYTDLVQLYAALRVNEETYRHAHHLLDLTESFERSGKGAAADTARAATEVALREEERLDIEGRLGVVSARLVQLLNLQTDTLLHPADAALVPLALIPEQVPVHDLVTQGLLNRPELAENRSLQAAALERWRAAKISPWVPNLRLAYAAGGFGGGRNSDFRDFDGRGDAIAAAVWDIKNLGLGDRAETRERQSQYTQLAFRQASVEARVLEEITAAFRVAFARRRELEAAQRAVVSARESYRLNEERIRRAPDQARPIELLQAIQALARARSDFLQVVADYNRAQFRLYAALGNPPLCALDHAAALAVSEPTVPPAKEPEKLPPPRTPTRPAGTLNE